jgi:signal transduction histidine kinase
MPGLETSKLFGQLNEQELRLLQSGAVVKDFPAEHVVFNEGDPGDGVYVVEEGAVRISALVAADERRVLARVGPGDFFGEMAVLDLETRSASAVTEKPSRLVFISREKLLGLIEHSPRLAASLVREFSLRMREFNRQYIREVLQAERLALVGKFARTIVHDFKNPLNIIGLAADLMDMEKASPEMRKNATTRIRKQVERLTNMINELLEFTRGSQQQSVHSSINYSAYLGKIIEEFGPDLADKRVNLILETPPPDREVLGDSKRLLHVYSNLFHNAVDAMPEGGEIRLRFSVTGDELITEVEDTGGGIPPEVLPRLFEAFASFGKAKGTGLGLSICKRIIEDHKGWIKTRSEPGRGAIFAFSLPLNKNS